MDIPFIDPVPAVIEEAERISGKGIEFIQKDDIPAYVVLQMARNNMPSHLIYHKKEHDEIINHLIVHECGHLLRSLARTLVRSTISFSIFLRASYFIC